MQRLLYSVVSGCVKWGGLACENLHPNSDVNVNVNWVLCSPGFGAL